MPTVQLEPGSLFAGDFRVVRRLGAGGMGALYVVEQLSTRAQRALKLMQPELVSDVRLRQRFEQEATVGARIESDHVVKVLGAGVDATSETPWLVMELLEGEDLASYVQRTGPMPRAEVLRVFEQLCHAVRAAHAANIVHRDLKPENVFLARSRIVGVPWIVKVLDFGIAKVASEAKTSDTATIGSPMWMAPEQGTLGEPVTPRTDVWALGLIAFYLLTGTSFWNGARDGTTNLMMLMREIMVDPIPSASQRAVEVGRAGAVPAGFDAWMTRAVVRDPMSRFADAGQLLESLVPLLTTPSAGATAPMLGQAPNAVGRDPSTPIVAAQSLPFVDRTVVEPAPKSKRGVFGAVAIVVLVVGGWGVTRLRGQQLAESVAAGNAAPTASATLAVIEANPPEAPAASALVVPSDSAFSAEAHSSAAHKLAHAPAASHSASAKGDAHTAPESSSVVDHAPVEGPSGAPADGSGFDRVAANAAMATARASAATCRRPADPPGEARVVVTFAPTGKVVDAHLEGPPFAGTATGHCIAAQYRAIAVPPFSGEPVVLRRKVPLD
jgi:tRNA A-37 threonylcarbamoyl transferase component Bud32